MCDLCRMSGIVDEQIPSAQRGREWNLVRKMVWVVWFQLMILAYGQHRCEYGLLGMARVGRDAGLTGFWTGVAIGVGFDG